MSDDTELTPGDIAQHGTSRVKKLVVAIDSGLAWCRYHSRGQQRDKVFPLAELRPWPTKSAGG